MLFEKYLSFIDKKKEEILNIADSLYDNPELGFREVYATDLIIKVLEENGFEITRNLCGIKTAFSAVYGEGEPSLGVLSEYDGLEGFSQKRGEVSPCSIDGKDTHHGCGHNLFAAGSVAAVLAIKEYIKETKKGKITFFGCPAEEGGGGKVFMARDGAFDKVDAVVGWHPESMYMVRTRPALANVSVIYTFDGISSHAGAAPDKGRSALDAVELMNVGVNFLREHMETTSRIHYAITDAGGHSPNVVQSHAVVKYMIRAVNSASVRELKKRVDKIAEGAALMTETTVTNKVVGAYADLITIPALQKTADEAMRDIPLPIPTQEEIEYAKELRKTMNLKEEKPLFATEVLEPMPPVAHGGSTDTADVSWCAPTVQMHIGTWVIGTAGHSWQAASQSGASYAKKAALYAGKAVAGTIMRLFENPEIIKNAKEEHKNKTQGGYICGIGKDLEPSVY